LSGAPDSRPKSRMKTLSYPHTPGRAQLIRSLAPGKGGPFLDHLKREKTGCKAGVTSGLHRARGLGLKERPSGKGEKRKFSEGTTAGDPKKGDAAPSRDQKKRSLVGRKKERKGKEAV